MRTRVDGANRAALFLLGLTLLAAGVLGLVLSFGGFGTDSAAGPVLPEQARAFAADQPWFSWAVAAACFVLALIGLRWLLAQLDTDRVGRLDHTADERDGLTTIHASAVTEAVQSEVEAIRGVAGASAHIRGRARRRLDLHVHLTDYADLAEVRQHLETQTVPHLRQALDEPDFPADIQLRPSASRSSRGLQLRPSASRSSRGLT